MMDYEKIIRSAKIEEIEQSVSDLFDKKIGENKSKHIEKFNVEIGLLNKILAQFYYLAQTLKAPDEDDRFYRRFLLGEGYLVTISNNFFTIKEMFISGLQIQLQIIMRNQIELISNLIAFIGDDYYFIRYGTDNFTTQDGYITPKTNHANKTLKKVIKDTYGKDSNEYLDVFIDLLENLYSDLSETTHGKFIKITIQAMGEVEDEVNRLDSGLFGVSIPIEATKTLLSHSSLLFQLSYLLIKIQLEKKGLLNHDSVYYDVINSYKKIDILNYKGLFNQKNSSRLCLGVKRKV